MEDWEWVAFIQREVEGWGWQLIRREEPRRVILPEGEAPHLLYKSNRGNYEGI